MLAESLVLEQLPSVAGSTSVCYCDGLTLATITKANDKHTNVDGIIIVHIKKKDKIYE